MYITLIVMAEEEKEEEKPKDLVLPDNFNELVERKAKEIAHKYKEQSPEMKQFNEKKAQISFYKEGGALPKDDTIAQLMIKEQMGRQIGLSFMESMTGLGFINGKVAIYGEVLLSRITQGGVKIDFKVSSKDSVTVVMTYKDNEQTSTQTLQEWIDRGTVPKKTAKGYYSSPWVKYPETMLRYKAVRHVAKFLCPHLLGSLPIMEDANEVISTQKPDPKALSEGMDDMVNQLEKAE